MTQSGTEQVMDLNQKGDKIITISNGEELNKLDIQLEDKN